MAMLQKLFVLMLFCGIFSFHSFAQSSSSASENDSNTSTKDTSFHEISGTSGVSAEWGSGWLDLDSLMTFKAGTTIRVEVGGEATKILVRLLKDGQSPDQPVGILGKFNVPESRVVEVKLPRTMRNVKQISVHGDHKAWDYFLGTKNGPATILNAAWK